MSLRGGRCGEDLVFPRVPSLLAPLLYTQYIQTFTEQYSPSFGPAHVPAGRVGVLQPATWPSCSGRSTGCLSYRLRFALHVPAGRVGAWTAAYDLPFMFRQVEWVPVLQPATCPYVPAGRVGACTAGCKSSAKRVPRSLCTLVVGCAMSHRRWVSVRQPQERFSNLWLVRGVGPGGDG